MNNKINILGVLSAVAVLAVGNHALAQSVKIGGSARQITVVGNNNVQAGLLASAKNSINAVDNMSVSGNFSQTVLVGNNTVRRSFTFKSQQRYRRRQWSKYSW